MILRFYRCWQYRTGQLTLRQYVYARRIDDFERRYNEYRHP